MSDAVEVACDVAVRNRTERLSIITMLLHVIADYRQRMSPTLATLQVRNDCEVSLAQLELGDYRVDERTVFKRMSIEAFADAVHLGTFLGQITPLADSPMRCALIIEGTQKRISNHHVSRHAIQGAIVVASFVLGVPVLRSCDGYESGWLITCAARNYSPQRAAAFARPDSRAHKKRRSALGVVQALPGIGPVRATQLLERFGSIEGIVRADVDALAMIPGIGRGLAANVRELLAAT